MIPYSITAPVQSKVPILISVPHCGTDFPVEIKNDYDQELITAPDDTDWFVDRLYDFAPEMGITMISAKYSRWVIDLNRDPESKPLYNDGRIITGLCTTTDFHDNPIYSKNKPDNDEIKRRVSLYYQPYHNKIQTLLDDLKNEFGNVLLWDAHSIRQLVPTIRKAPFPDLILGSADETAAHPELIKTALRNLGNAGYELKHNFPFKGGQITRSFGKPTDNQHALQLEMSKVMYMDDTETMFDETRADKIRKVLKNTLSSLVSVIHKI